MTDKLRFKSITKKEAYKLKAGVFVLVQFSDVPKLHWGILLSRFPREAGDSCADVFFSKGENNRFTSNIWTGQVVGVSKRTAHALWEASDDSKMPDELGNVEFFDDLVSDEIEGGNIVKPN